MDLIPCGESSIKDHMHPTDPPRRYRAITGRRRPDVPLHSSGGSATIVRSDAENGLEAIQAAEALHPDLVFLDISMPF